VSGYGPGGYPGQGYDEDPGQRGGYDQGYGDPRRYGGQEYGGYDPRGHDRQGTGGYRTQGTRPQPGQYDPRQGTGPRRRQGQGPRQGQRGYDQRMSQPPRGYNEWDADSDSSFLPGFGGRDDQDSGRARERGGRAQERGGRYDDRSGRDDRDGRYDDRDSRYDDRGGRYADRGGRGPGDRGGRGPDPRDPRDSFDARGDRPADRRPLTDDDWDDRNRKPRKKATRWFPRILVLAVVGVIVIGGGIGGLKIYHKYQERYHPADYTGQGTGDVTVQVPSGATAFSLAPELLKLGVIASERAFTNAAENAPAATGAGQTGLQAGYFQLHLHMQASLAYAALLNPKNVVQTTVTIPEGKRVSQILTILAAHTKIPLAQFEAAAKQTSKLGLPSYAGTTVKLPATVPYGQLEGYLFPATYAVTPHETALQVLQAMVQRYNIEAQQINIEQAAKSVGLTPSQLIIEASMVQAEAGVNADMPKMARVIINRKAKGMADGFSSVDFYGLGKYGINLTNSAEAQASGPYDNTQKPGLPPTPVDNPGDAAIQAVLHPASGPWLYFVTTAVGKPTQFSATCFQGTCGG
jgi:peptidoglycan lytic transglycosylase G